MESAISIGNNIARIRKEGKLTQEDLAFFLGVTKASVSKWETGQSYPDIELLPRIAMYFGITIDELIGYEPQMTKQEIRETYARLSRAFAKKPFAEAHEDCQKLVHDYFSCYPLLVQIATLYLNHVSLVAPDMRSALIAESIELCQRVRRGSDSSAHIRQAEAIEATLLLLSGNARGVTELLADAAMPDMGADILLSNAYAALGQTDKADTTLQAMVFQGLVLMLNRLSSLALLHASDPEWLERAHERSCALIDAFNLEEVFVNCGAIHLAFATAYLSGGNTDAAIGCLEDYERACRALTFPIKLRGDDFFDKIDVWVEEMNDIGTDLPRTESLTRQSIVASVAANPAFAPLADDLRFKRIVKSLEAIAR